MYLYLAKPIIFPYSMYLCSLYDTVTNDSSSAIVAIALVAERYCRIYGTCC